VIVAGRCLADGGGQLVGSVLSPAVIGGKFPSFGRVPHEHFLAMGRGG